MRGVSVRVLLAEDEEHLGAILEMFLRGRGHQVKRVRDGRAALDALQAEAFDVALLDIMMPELDGLEVLRAQSGLAAPPEVVVMTGNGTVDTALTAMQLGAYDYVAKPYRMAEVDMLVGLAAEKRALRLAAAARRWYAGGESDAFLTQMSGLRALLTKAERDARGNSHGLWVIAGPAGSGRRTLASWLHARSGRAAELALFVAATGDPVADSAALLGVDGGVGDAAVGALEAAPRGMVVVDDWSRLAPSVRVALSRAAAAGRFQRAERGAEVPFETRLCVCVSDPAAMPASMLTSASLVAGLPPLSVRGADIRILAEHFLRVAGSASGRSSLMLAEDAAARLARHGWPGHVAELRDVINAAVCRMEGKVLHAANLALAPLTDAAVGGDGSLAEPARASASLAELERRHIAAVLEELDWHRGRVAKRLGISARTLYRRIRQLGLEQTTTTRARTPGRTESSE